MNSNIINDFKQIKVKSSKCDEQFPNLLHATAFKAKARFVRGQCQQIFPWGQGQSQRQHPWLQVCECKLL